MAIAALVIVSGCSFDGSTQGSSATNDSVADLSDASERPLVDANTGARPDASFDAMPPSWTVVETMTVDSANSSPTYSQTVLENGVVYRLRASGSLSNVIDPYAGDADYFDFGNPKDLGCCEDIGLGIDDDIVDDKLTAPDWGPYDPSHIYEVEWTGDGTTIFALFQDTYYGNNVGSLTLEILSFE